MRNCKIRYECLIEWGRIIIYRLLHVCLHLYVNTLSAYQFSIWIVSLSVKNVAEISGTDTVVLLTLYILNYVGVVGYKIF